MEEFEWVIEECPVCGRTSTEYHKEPQVFQPLKTPCSQVCQKELEDRHDYLTQA